MGKPPCPVLFTIPFFVKLTKRSNAQICHIGFNRRALLRAGSAAANQSAWARAGVVIKPARDHAVNDCGSITRRTLHEPLTTSGQVLPDL